MISNFVALIVEDDPFQRECLADLLKGEGLEVVECANGEVAELILATTGTELRALVTDVQLGGGTPASSLRSMLSASSRTSTWCWSLDMARPPFRTTPTFL
jgi:CheY-like chemotaxis protein